MGIRKNPARKMPRLEPRAFLTASPENDARVLDGVVLVHFEVSTHREFQIHRAMPRHKRQHVIEKRNVRRNFCASLPV